MQEQWRIKELLEWTTRFFADKGMEKPRLEAEVLLARVLEKDRVFLYAHYDQPVNSQEREKYRHFIQRRLKGEPAAYIAGHKEFMSLDFKVSPAVLIPRPETELLVEKVLELAMVQNNPRICDVGTGSGAIAVSLAVYCPAAQIYASDISAAALVIARENALRHQARVQFVQGDLLAPLQAEGGFDIIVANLPYISEAEFQTLEAGIREYEPASALIAPGDGLDIYRRWLPQASQLLKDDGYLLFEIAPQQSTQALEMLEGFAEVAVIEDLAGRQRLVKARKG
ncbi:MAG: peptide chain release factor N(5)-glutamine methyltransferase [Syntrophomonadaceae bacterium]|nr:peptide chain release factor N(5)-glutamine methyltransferase [Syntrophomonadaceae bacterium]